MQQPEHDLRPFQAPIASPRRFISVGLVAALHVVVIYALATGLAARMINKLPDELKAQVVEQKPPEQEKTPPPPPPDLAKPPPPFVPPPDINIQSDAPATNAISNVQSRQVAPPPAKIIGPRPRGRQTQPTYPPISRRLGQEGTVLLRITVDVNGNVVAAKVEKSSGYSRLDESALEWVKRRHYHPATQGGKPIEAQTQIRYRFSLRS